jgi:hypothetical protein
MYQVAKDPADGAGIGRRCYALMLRHSASLGCSPPECVPC